MTQYPINGPQAQSLADTPLGEARIYADGLSLFLKITAPRAGETQMDSLRKHIRRHGISMVDILVEGDNVTVQMCDQASMIPLKLVGRVQRIATRKDDVIARIGGSIIPLTACDFALLTRDGDVVEIDWERRNNQIVQTGFRNISLED